jgi:hypothetical protein
MKIIKHKNKNIYRRINNNRNYHQKKINNKIKKLNQKFKNKNKTILI